MKRKFFIIFMISLYFSFIIFNCKQERIESDESGSIETGANEDGSGAGENDSGGGTTDITELNAISENETVILTWKDPDASFDHIEITWAPDGPIPQTVVAGMETFTAIDLINGDEYTFTIRSVDASDTVTCELTISATPAKPEAPANAIYIYTTVEMYNVRNDLDGYFILMEDIDLSGYSTGGGWVPIGTDSVNFTGTFDGNEHIISGLMINRPANDYQGLFGYIGSESEIKDLRMEGIAVNGSNFIGGLIGASLGIINNSYATGLVEGSNYVGGLVGGNAGTINNSYATGIVNGYDIVGGLAGGNAGTIDNSHSTCDMNGHDSIGGLVGYNYYGSIIYSYAEGTVIGTYDVGGLVGINEGTISDSFATGIVSGYDYIGGLIGGNSGGINNSYAEGTVTGTYDIGGLSGINIGIISHSYYTGAVNGYDSVGGLVGRNTGTISYSYATSVVSENNYYIGGLVGENDGSISYSYATGAVTGTYDVGGLVGYNHNDGIISFSYATGTVDGSGEYIGGLAGYNYNGSISYSYAIGVVTGSVSGGFCGYSTGSIFSCYFNDDNNDDIYAIGATLEEMRDSDTYAGWDFTSTSPIWSIGSLNSGYPYLTNNPPAD